MKVGDVCFHFELDITSEGNVACYTCGKPFCAVPSCPLLADFISEGKLAYCSEHILDDESRNGEFLCEQEKARST